MVRCLFCLNKLPYKCTCKVPKKTKLKRFYEAAIRECQLCLAIMKGHKPKIKIGNKTYEVSQIKREGTLFKLIFPLTNDIDWERYKTFTLFDKDGKPLYRYSLKKLGIKAKKGDTLTLEFNIGAEL